MWALRIEPDLALCIAIFCGSTDLLQRICEIVTHVACEKHFSLSLLFARLLNFSQMSARCGERNSSLTRTGTSTDARAAGVLLALHHWTRESRVSSETRARRSALAGQGRSGVLSLHTLNCSRLACSSPSLCCRIIRIFSLKALRDSLVFISPA